MRCVVMVCVALLGCEGGSSDTGQALPAEHARQLCIDHCAHRIECGEIVAEAECQAVCVAAAPHLRGAWMRAAYDCEIATPCNTAQTCRANADLAGASDAHREYMTKCLAIAERCPNTELPGGTEKCRVSQVVKYTDAFMTSDVIPCTEMPCGDITECFETLPGFNR